MFRRIAVSLLALLLLIVPFAAYAEPTDGSLQYILNKGTLVVGFDPGFPPMGFTDEDGEAVGFDLDVAYAVCDLLGVEMVPQPIDWDAKEMELNAKNIDCIWNGFSITPEREEAFSLSMPYMSNEQVLVVRSDSPYHTMADLAGKTLGVQAESSAVDALNAAADFKATLSEVAEFDMNTILLMDLERGGVDVALLDVIVADYYMTIENVEFRVLEEALAPEFFAVGFRKDDVALTEAVNQALIALVFGEHNILAEISTEWFTDDVTIIDEMVAMSEEH